jgi:transposase
VVGRKNHYGSRSLRGTQVAALFYTLCETARLAGVDPQAYLLNAVCVAIARPGAGTFPEVLIPATTI